MDTGADAMPVPDRLRWRWRLRGVAPAAGGPPSVADDVLIGRVAVGDAAALASLYQRHAGTLLSFVERCTGHAMATADGRLAVQRVLGYLPQDLGVYPDLTARQFLDYVALLKGLDDRRQRRRRVGELLELVNLGDAADRKLRGYSGGMRRRAGIAQALLNDPELLVVDEPTSGLNPEERIRFRTLLSQLAGSRTVLLSTHIVDDVAQTCTELAVLGRGRVIYRGTVGELTAMAEGKVWSLLTDGQVPAAGTVLSSVPQAGGTRYRVVAPSRPCADADPVAPTLEDGYVALAQQHSLAAAESAA